MKVIACQMDIAWEAKPDNFATVNRLVTAAAPSAGSLVVLPEMFATGFSMNVADIAETPSGETARFLATTARQHRVWLLGGVALRAAAGRGANEAMAFAPSGKMVARYRKNHTFSPGGESRHCVAGTKPTVFTCRKWSVAPFVCYDLRFPECFRSAIDRGAQLLVVIANWPAARTAHWLVLLQARAIENQAWVVGVNRCGRDPYQSYDGRSLIVDPRGRIVADAGVGEGCLEAELDLAELRKYRRAFPVLADRWGSRRKR